MVSTLAKNRKILDGQVPRSRSTLNSYNNFVHNTQSSMNAKNLPPIKSRENQSNQYDYMASTAHDSSRFKGAAK